MSDDRDIKEFFKTYWPEDIGRTKEKAANGGMTRKQANMEILRLLANYINMYPDQRWGQVLRNTGCVQDHTMLPYKPQDMPMIFWKREMLEEPHVILERMRKELSGD